MDAKGEAEPLQGRKKEADNAGGSGEVPPPLLGPSQPARVREADNAGGSGEVPPPPPGPLQLARDTDNAGGSGEVPPPPPGTSQPARVREADNAGGSGEVPPPPPGPLQLAREADNAGGSGEVPPPPPGPSQLARDVDNAGGSGEVPPPPPGPSQPARDADNAGGSGEVPPPPPGPLQPARVREADSTGGSGEVPPPPPGPSQPARAREADKAGGTLQVPPSPRPSQPARARSMRKSRRTRGPVEPARYMGPLVPSDEVEPNGCSLVTWGMGEMGQLGLGPDVLEKKRPVRVQPGTKFTQLACGGIFTLAVELAMDSTGEDVKSKVVSMGCNDEYALGRETEEEEEAFVPGKMDLSSFAPFFKVAKIVGGDTHGAALTQDGRVFVWGTIRSEDGRMGLVEYRQVQKAPIELDFTKTAKRTGNNVDENKFIVDICSGSHHVVMLSRSGIAYTMGGYFAGQLGRIGARFLGSEKENRMRYALTPHPVSFAVKMKGKQEFDAIFATTAGSFFRDKSTGELFACGLNKYGQLGVTPDGETTGDRGLEPFLVSCDLINDHLTENAPGCFIVKIVGGRDHSILLANNGEAYSIGHIFFLGAADGEVLDITGEDQNSYSPVPVRLNSRFPDDARDGSVVDIAAGDAVSFAVVEKRSGDLQLAQDNSSDANGDSGGKTRFLLSWGHQTMSQLGRNTESDSPEPEIVNLGSAVPLKISVGGQHVAALVRETRPEFQ